MSCMSNVKAARRVERGKNMTKNKDLKFYGLGPKGRKGKPDAGQAFVDDEQVLMDLEGESGDPARLRLAESLRLELNGG